MTGQRVVMGVIPGLPPIKYLAAGQQHCLMSDGERVWCIGKQPGVMGEKDMESVPWSRPKARSWVGVQCCEVSGSQGLGAMGEKGVESVARFWGLFRVSGRDGRQGSGVRAV